MEQNKLSKLREEMKKYELDGYLIPHDDAHFSEYIAGNDERVKFISNFTGENSLVFVTFENAFLFVDSRFQIQSKKECDLKVWKIKEIGRGLSGNQVLKCIKSNIKSEGRVGIDPCFVNHNDFKTLQSVLSSQEIQLDVDLPTNLVNVVWKQFPEKPNLETKKSNPFIFILDEKYHGEMMEKKLDRVRIEMFKKGCSYLVLTALDDIAWLTNLRGNGVVPFCGTFHSFMIVPIDENAKCRLYMDPKLLREDDREVANYLKKRELIMEILPYENFYIDIQRIGDLKGMENMEGEKKSEELFVQLDGDTTNFRLVLSISVAFEKGILPKFGKSPIKNMKPIKNECEIMNFRKALVKDGVVHVKFFCWLEELIARNPESENLTEFNVSKQLEQFRKDTEGFVCNSFKPIIATGDHGAIIHYSSLDKERKLNTKEVFLLDSGGHYLEGTTDISRTLFFGDPSDEIVRNFTLVLKGHISLASLVFPQNVPPIRFWGLPRLFLWEHGLDYAHGTTHGIGYLLNVHEEPYFGGEKWKEGQILTIEPGFYKENHYGIRIENDYLLKVSSKSGSTKFLEMEQLTWCPIQLKLIDKNLLTKKEVDWINNYHKRCYEVLNEFLEDDEKSLKWLKENTRII